MKKIYQISLDNAGNRALTVSGHECGPGIPNLTHFWATWDGFHRIRLDPYPVCKWGEYGEDNTQERGAWTCGYIVVVFGRVFPSPSKAPSLLGSFVV